MSSRSLKKRTRDKFELYSHGALVLEGAMSPSVKARMAGLGARLVGKTDRGHSGSKIHVYYMSRGR